MAQNDDGTYPAIVKILRLLVFPLFKNSIRSCPLVAQKKVQNGDGCILSPPNGCGDLYCFSILKFYIKSKYLLEAPAQGPKKGSERGLQLSSHPRMLVVM